MTLDVRRHMELFDPYSFNTPIHVIGAGATGSWLTLCLAKLGIRGELITVWDFDKVEGHNIANQAYAWGDIGEEKVEALSDLICEQVSTVVNYECAKVANQRLEGFVFVMVDSMAGRREIWKNCLKLKPAVKHVIEPRMGLDVGRIYNVNPNDMYQIKRYEDCFYDDDAAPVSACGTSQTVITTAMSVASQCARQLINVVNDVPVDNEILLDFKYNNIICNKW